MLHLFLISNFFHSKFPFIIIGIFAKWLVYIVYFAKEYIYRTRTIITRSRFEAALVYKPRILSLKSEEFPFLVHKLCAI